MMRHQLTAAVLAALVTAIAATAEAQVAPSPQLPPRDGRLPAAQGTAGIMGRVVQLDTGQPLRRVRITARPSSGSTSQSVTTDNEGRFAFTALPAGGC